MEFTGWLTPDEFWDQYDRMEDLVRGSAGDIPCYGVSGWSGPIALGEWDLGGRPPSTAGLAHGSAIGPNLQTWTTTQDPRMFVALRRMAAGGPPASGDDLDRRMDALLAETGEEVLMSVDDVQIPFKVWREADHWWAAAQHDGYGLILEANSMEPGSFALNRIRDIGPYLDGRRAQIRASRGES